MSNRYPATRATIAAIGRPAGGTACLSATVRCTEDRRREAAFCAVGVAMNLFLRGKGVAGSRWLSRAQRLLAECAQHGYARHLVEVEGALDGSATPPSGAVVAFDAIHGQAGTHGGGHAR